MADKKRILWVDQLKGIVFFPVLLGHASGIGDRLRSYIYSFHMPLFLMITGLTLNIEKVYEMPFFSYVYKLFKRMLVPYVWLNLLSLTVRYFISVFITHKSFSVFNYLKGMLISNTQLPSSPCPAAPTYYIILLFLAQIFLWAVIKVCKKDRLKIGIVCSVLCLLSIVTQKVPMIWHINVVPVAMLWIFLGNIIMVCYKSVSDRLNALKIPSYFILCAVCFAVGFVVWMYNGRVSIHGNYYGESFLLFILAALATSIGIILLTIKLPDTKIFTYVGKNTLFYLGTHTVIMLIINNIFRELKNESWFFFVHSLAVYFMLIPLTAIANRLVPYINGNPLTQKSILTEVCKILCIAAAGFVPCNQFVNKFGGGILESSVGMKAATVVGYIVLCIAVCFVFNKVFPFMFVADKKKSK